MRVDGQIAFVEFPGRDLAGMRRFYDAAFGWKSEHRGHDYVAFHGVGAQGGFSAHPSLAPLEPLVVLYVRDLEAVRARVIAAGGEITRDIFACSSGRRLHFRDPGENEVAVWSDEPPPPAPPATRLPAPGPPRELWRLLPSRLAPRRPGASTVDGRPGPR